MGPLVFLIKAPWIKSVKSVNVIVYFAPKERTIPIGAQHGRL
jgi:hypothetical protein